VHRDRRKAPHHADPYSRRHDALAVVRLTYSQSRYPLGEVVVQTVYRFSDGSRDTDPPRRVYLGQSTGPAIREIWDVVFDAAALGRQFQPQALILRLYPAPFPLFWEVRLRALAEVVAEELGVVVAGTAFDSGLR
jgi:hypothetical protein